MRVNQRWCGSVLMCHLGDHPAWRYLPSTVSVDHTGYEVDFQVKTRIPIDPEARIFCVSRSAWRSDQNCDYRLRPDGKRTKGPRGNHSDGMAANANRTLWQDCVVYITTMHVYRINISQMETPLMQGGVICMCGDYRTNPLQQLYWLKMLLTTHSWFVA